MPLLKEQITSANATAEAIDKSSEQKRQLSKRIEPKFLEPLNLELKDFVNCIKNRKQPIANGEVGARVVKIAELATKSLRLQKPVKL